MHIYIYIDQLTWICNCKYKGQDSFKGIGIYPDRIFFIYIFHYIKGKTFRKIFPLKKFHKKEINLNET